MQAYDLIMLIVLGMSTIFGAIKGLAWQVASLASIIVSYIVAYKYRFQVAEMIDAKPPWNMFLAMLILYMGTGFVIWIGFRLMSGFIDRIRLKDFDRHLGALFGFAKGLVFCLLITMFAMTLLGPTQQAAICQSRSGYYITAALDKSAGILPNEIRDVVGPYLARLEDQLKQPHDQPQETQLEGWPQIPSAEQPSFDPGNFQPSNFNATGMNPGVGFPGLGINGDGSSSNIQPPSWPASPSGEAPSWQNSTGSFSSGESPSGLRSAGANPSGGGWAGGGIPR